MALTEVQIATFLGDLSERIDRTPPGVDVEKEPDKYTWHCNGSTGEADPFEQARQLAGERGYQLSEILSHYPTAKCDCELVFNGDYDKDEAAVGV